MVVTDKGKKRFDEVSIEAATFYSGEDADITLQLHQAIYPQLTPVQVHVLETIEMPLVSVLADMEDSGVLIDEKILKAQGVLLKQEINVLEKEAYALVGREFNLQSPTQLQAILFEEQ